MNNYSETRSAAHILIIGDIPFDLSFIFCLLIQQGYIIHSTGEGERGLEMAETLPISLIVISSAIEEPDCYSLCEKIKNTNRLRETPVLFINGDNTQFKPPQVFKIGGDDYVSHPFSPEELLTRVKHLLEIEQLKKNLEGKSIKLKSTLEELEKLENYIQEVYDELRSYSFLDSLTQIANKRSFEQYINREWKRCLRDRISNPENEPIFLSLVLCDVDYFKAYNDVYGMAAGDECLQKIASVIQGEVKRPADIVARHGGDSFLILLPGTNYEGAVTVVNLIREKLKELEIVHPYSPLSDQITLSYAIVTCQPDKNLSPEILIHKSSQMLKGLKEEGGNSIIGETVLNNSGDEAVDEAE